MKTYKDTISEIFELQQFSIKMGLENITTLCRDLQHPQSKFPVIHIAGTNGKGSTSRMIQALLSAHGLKTGLYTSPHLVDFRERITVDGAMIEEAFILSFWQRIAPLVRSLKATFFDTTTALAFDYFNDQKVDIAVIETGLGGRLDSTNIVKPAAVVITPVSVDHVQQLGRSLKGIAREKGAIIKAGAVVFLARQDIKAAVVLRDMAAQGSACYHLSDQIMIRKIETAPSQTSFDLFDRQRRIRFRRLLIGLAGGFQTANAGLAYLTARWYLEQAGIPFSEETMRTALTKITWSGRLQRISVLPDIYLDVSHNYGGFKHSLPFISRIGTIDSRYLLLGLLEDKAYREIIRLLQKSFRSIVLTEPRHGRPLPAGLMAEEFGKYGIKTKSLPDIPAAYEFCLKKLKKSDQLFIMGSHYLVGEILQGWDKNT